MNNNNSNQFLAQACMNVVACPTCALLNEHSRRPEHFGNVFVPISLWKLAFIRGGHTVQYRVKCNEGHSAVVVAGA